MALIWKSTRWIPMFTPGTQYRVFSIFIEGKNIDGFRLYISDTIDGAGTAIHTTNGLGNLSLYIHNDSSMAYMFKSKIRGEICGSDGVTPEIVQFRVMVIPEPVLPGNEVFQQKAIPLNLTDNTGANLVEIDINNGFGYSEKYSALELGDGYWFGYNLIPYDFNGWRAIYEPVSDGQLLPGDPLGLYLDKGSFRWGESISFC